MWGSPQLGLRAKRSYPAVAPVLVPYFPLAKHHLHLCGAVMTVGTSSLAHHAVSCLTPVCGQAWVPLPLHSYLFIPLDL